MTELIDLITKTWGIAGLLILAPMIAVVYLWKDSKRMGLEISKARDGEVKAQEQRVADAKATQDKLIEVISEQSKLNTETNIALDHIGSSLTILERR